MNYDLLEPFPDEYFMAAALREAENAFKNEEVPIGAVVVLDNKIIGRGFNMIEKMQDATAHAEVIAIGAAAKEAGSWRLHDCTLYVTLEPCMMCLGASLQSRVKRIVFGASDSRFGAVTTRPHREVAEEAYRRWPEVTGGIMADEAREMIQAFFKMIRQRTKDLRKAAALESDEPKGRRKSTQSNPTAIRPTISTTIQSVEETNQPISGQLPFFIDFSNE